VGSNNRVAGRATGVSGEAVELVTPEGLYLFARRLGEVSVGDAVEAFVRPEAALLARDLAELPAEQPSYAGRVESVLFDGANSTVQLREVTTQLDFRVALPHIGRLADLRVGEAVHFGFDPQRAVCFRAVDAAPAGLGAGAKQAANAATATSADHAN
jgi:spermidine/putrescine transport system ATP-binding protein